MDRPQQTAGLEDGDALDPATTAHFLFSQHPEIAQAVVGLVEEIAHGDPRTHTSYLGRGGSWQAFEFQHGDQTLVLKISAGEQHTPGSIRSAAEKLKSGEDIPELEQVVAIEPERGIIVTTRIPGKRVVDLTPEELAAIPDEHFVQAIKTIEQGTDSRVVFDMGPKNVLYDKKTGFGFIDFVTGDSQMTHERDYHIGHTIAGLGVGLQNAGFIDHAKGTLEQKSSIIESMKAGIEASHRLHLVSQGCVNDKIFANVTAILEGQTSSMQDVIDGYEVELGRRDPIAPPADAWWNKDSQTTQLPPGPAFD